MNAAQQISLFGGLFYVCLAIAIIGLGLAVFFFFFFDIRSVRALMTGKAKRQTIERMTEQNSKTGRLAYTPVSGNIKSENLASPGNVAEANMETEALGGNMETAVLSNAFDETALLNQPDVCPVAPSQRSMDAGMTTPLSSANRVSPDIRFDVTERTLVIHTHEII